MDGIIKAAGTSGAPAVDDDDGMQCTKHPYRNNAANGGICGLCLQDKLGKLVSSPNGGPFSPSPSLRSDPSAAANAAASSLTLSLRPAPAASVSSSSSTTNVSHRGNQITATRRARIPFLFSNRKKKAMADLRSSKCNLVLKRSKSAVTSRRHPSSAGEEHGNGDQKRGGFWSFLFYSKSKPDKSSSSSSSSVRDLNLTAGPTAYRPLPVVEAAVRPLQTRKPLRAEYVVVVDETVDSPNSGTTNATASFGRKVSRSRSVGCGSRSFSGDFFERISTGFGDCTLRRLESQREGKRYSSGDAVKEKVRCAGIFGGLMMTSSTSSSYWVSAGEEHHDVNRKESSAADGRSRSWGWALTSPMRALGKPSPSPSSTTELKTAAIKSNASPNLAAVPSLLIAKG